MKKYLAVLLALCLISVCFIGCGETEKKPADDKQQNEQTDDDQKQEEEEKAVYDYPRWLGNSTGATTTVGKTSPKIIAPGTNEIIATAPKYTVDANDPKIVRTEETAISFRTVLKEGETEFNWDENSELNKWDTSHVYVDINLTGSRFDLIDTDLDGKEDALPMTHRMYLRIARYGNQENDQHPYLDPKDGVKSNYLCSMFYDRSSIVCFSTTDSYFRGTETYDWMQKLLAGEKVYIKWQVSYHFTPDEEEGAMLFEEVGFTVYFGNAVGDGVKWIDGPSFYDPVNVFKIDGVQDPNGDIVNPAITGNTFSCGSCLNQGQYVSDFSIHVSPNANFNVEVDSVEFGKQ